jgi:hypothetical protein
VEYLFISHYTHLKLELSRRHFIRQTILLISFPILLLLPLMAFAQASKFPPDQLKVHLVLNKQEFRLGERIELKVEILNASQKPLLIANEIYLSSGLVSYLEPELSDSRGPISPRGAIISDRFSPLEKKSASETVLNFFLLLRPETSFVERFKLFDLFDTFGYVLHPGTYSLKAYYSSNGLFYPPAYQMLGLTEEDVNSLPFQAWHGKLATNEVSFRILPVAKKQ